MALDERELGRWEERQSRASRERKEASREKGAKRKNETEMEQHEAIYKMGEAGHYHEVEEGWVGAGRADGERGCQMARDRSGWGREGMGRVGKGGGGVDRKGTGGQSGERGRCMGKTGNRQKQKHWTKRH